MLLISPCHRPVKDWRPGYALESPNRLYAKPAIRPILYLPPAAQISEIFRFCRTALIDRNYVGARAISGVPTAHAPIAITSLE